MLSQHDFLLAPSFTTTASYYPHYLLPPPLPFQPPLLSFLSLTCFPGMSWPGTGRSYLPKPHCFCCPLASDSGRNPIH